MNEREILNSIKENAEKDFSPDFEALMNRIENQSEEEKKQSRKDALELMPEPQKRGISEPVRRLLVTAAALAVTAGVGFGLIVLSLGSMGAKEDSAAYEATEVCEDGAYAEEAASEYEYAEEYEPLPEEDVSVELPSDVSDSDAAAEASPGKLDDGAASENNEASEEAAIRGFVEYSVGQLGMTLELPEDSFITGRSVSKDFPLLKVYEMDAAQLEANYRQRGIYCNALWYDDSADITEIVVTKSIDRTSERIYNMKKAGEYNINRVKSMYLDYAADGEEYYAVDTVENGQALFFRACGRVDNANGRSNHLQYMTIINGCRIEITLIEHFGINVDADGTEPAEISREHLELMEHVIQSAHWKNVKSGFFNRYKGMIFYSTLAIAAAASITIVNLVQKKKQTCHINAKKSEDI